MKIYTEFLFKKTKTLKKKGTNGGVILSKIEKYILSERIPSYEKITVVTLTNKINCILIFEKQKKQFPTT